jgi:hypothetical protein
VFQLWLGVVDVLLSWACAKKDAPLISATAISGVAIRIVFFMTFPRFLAGKLHL